jgi:hypothetical protein
MFANSQGQSVEGSNQFADTSANDVAGRWTYRSFHSQPDMSTNPAALLFGRGTLELAVSESGQLSGTLGGTGWELTLNGRFNAGAPKTIRFRGKGVIGNEPWVYDYVGYVVPKWPNGVDQRPAIVGSIVRTVPHSNGTATAGYVAQWIAVKQDSNRPTNTGAILGAPAEDELRQLENEWAAAVATNDADTIGRFFPEKLLFVGAGGVLQNRDEHLDDFRSGRLRISSVRVEDFVAHVYDRFAVVNTIASVKGHFANRDISGKYRFMDTWRMSNNGWQAVARQQTRVASTEAPSAGLMDAPRDVIRQPDAYRQKVRDSYLQQPTLNSLQKQGETAPGDSSTTPNRAARRVAAMRSSLQPKTISSTNGRLDLDLCVEYATVQIGNHSARLRTYNGQLAGPVLRAKAGDTLHITLHRYLSL